MKNYKFTFLLGWMLFLSSTLFAQNKEGRFNLKEGDWFEVQAEHSDILTITYSENLHIPMQKEMNEETYLLNYQLQKQLPNGNQRYKIRLEHFKGTKKFGKYFLGYDSYYPKLEENKKSPEIKNQYNLEVKPNGEIVDFNRYKSNKSRIIYTSIKSSYGGNYSYTYSDQASDSLMVRIFSGNLMKPDSFSKKVVVANNSRIPTLTKNTNLKLYITKASFPLPDNTIIKIKDQSNQNIRISPFDGNNEDFISMQRFKTVKDSSLTCSLFLTKPQHLKIRIGNRILFSFMEPGDTLKISEIEHQNQPKQYSAYPKSSTSDFISSEKKMSDHFSGNAAYNTMISTEIEQYRHGFPPNNDILTVIKYYKVRNRVVNELLDYYSGKASENCIDYFRSDWKYILATEKLRFYQEIDFDMKISDKNLPELNHIKDFFLDIDTLSILMNPYDWNRSYQEFIRMSQAYKQKRLGWAVGKGITDNFFENYYFVKASLRGYPLYNQMAELIDRELRRNLSDIDTIESYYQGFINNCADPTLTEPIKKVHDNALQLKIGKVFPINSFRLKDSSIFDLKKYKGKPVCIIRVSYMNANINFYKDIVKNFKPDEVNFIFVSEYGNYQNDQKLDSVFLEKSNIKIIGLVDYPSAFRLCENKIFILDKWFRITENNLEDLSFGQYITIGAPSKLEKSLRKAIEAKRYSKAEKTSMIKTAGWSFGSILFTLLIGWWIYRVRIKRIKKQEAAKRRIKELEIKAIRSQMNPHFIFNALNSIQSLINGNQFKEANIYLSKFAVLLRGVLNNSEKNRISLSDELQAVELYCQLEQLRFEFQFEISIDPQVNGDLIEIPGMIIQPLAENAVVHGLSAKGDQGKLDIQVKQHNGNLCVCISDNGAGLSSQKTDELSQKGFGLKLVEERINILNLDGKEAKLTVENNSNKAGTIATLIIPID